MVVEVVAGVLIGLLAVATVIAAYLGILGLARAANLTWCRFCRRLELRPSGAGDSCVRADRAGIRSTARPPQCCMRTFTCPGWSCTGTSSGARFPLWSRERSTV